MLFSISLFYILLLSRHDDDDTMEEIPIETTASTATVASPMKFSNTCSTKYGTVACSLHNNSHLVFTFYPSSTNVAIANGPSNVHDIGGAAEAAAATPMVMVSPSTDPRFVRLFATQFKDILNILDVKFREIGVYAHPNGEWKNEFKTMEDQILSTHVLSCYSIASDMAFKIILEMSIYHGEVRIILTRQVYIVDNPPNANKGVEAAAPALAPTATLHQLHQKGKWQYCRGPFRFDASLRELNDLRVFFNDNNNAKTLIFSGNPPPPPPPTRQPTLKRALSKEDVEEDATYSR